MRLFRAKSTYVYLFCVYAINALFLLFHSVKKYAPLHATPLLIAVSQVLGMVLLAVLAFFAIRRTSSGLEKCVLVLTGSICLLFVAGVLSEYGYSLPSPLHLHSAFVVTSCATALLAGWRTLQIMTGKENEAD
jgi:predicted neutral ceramidase superfamily lipid hydrolase